MSRYSITVRLQDDKISAPQTSPRNKLEKFNNTSVLGKFKSLSTGALVAGAYSKVINKTADSLDFVNGLVGDWTEQRVRQKKNSIALRRSRQILTGRLDQFVKSEISEAYSFSLKGRKSSFLAQTNTFLSGNNTNSGSRYRGVRR